jgi:hypothetical protein
MSLPNINQKACFLNLPRPILNLGNLLPEQSLPK